MRALMEFHDKKTTVQVIC